MRNKIFLTLFLFSTFLNVDAQNYKKGFKKINAQDYFKAEKIFTKALAKNNTDAIANYGLSLIYSNFNYPNFDLFKAYHLINIANKNKEQSEPIKEYFTIDKISIEKERIDKELFKLLQSKNNLYIVNKFLSECQNSRYYKDAIKIRNKLEFERAQNINTIKSFNNFIQLFPDAEQINQAIEIRNKLAFERAQNINTIKSFNNFIHLFPDAEQINQAIEIRNKLAFKRAQNINTIKSFNNFIHLFPDAEQINQAIEIRNKLAFEKAKSSKTIESYDFFLNNYPEASQFNEIKNLKAELILWEKAEQDSSITKIDTYLTKYPQGQYSVNALRLKEDLFWKKVLKDTSLTLINKYLTLYPKGKYVKEADTLETISKRLYALKEIKKYLRNNQIINSFLIDKNGTINLMFKKNLYYLCNDYGDSWCRLVKNVSSVSFSPNDINTIYAINNNNDIVKSSNAGKNWITIKNGLPNNIKLLSIFINPHNSSEIFLTSDVGIYKTSDAGFSWQPFKMGIIPYQFIIDANDKNKFYLLSNEGPCVSSDAGISWKIIGNTLPKILVKGAGRSANYSTVNAYNMINISHNENSTILLFTNNGIYKTENDGENWTEINNGFSKTATVTSVFLSEDEILLGCREFNSKLNKNESAIYKSDYTNKRWEKINIDSNELQEITGIYKSPLHSGIFIKSNDKIAYIDSSLNLIGLNYGITNHSKVYAFSTSKRKDKVIQYAIVENNNYVDIKRYGIWHSENNGISWKESLIYDHYNDGTNTPRRIFISPFNPLEIWSFDQDFNFVSYDGGNTWMNIKELNLPYIGYLHISDFSFDYQNHNNIYFFVGENYYSSGGETSYLIKYDKNTKNHMTLCESGGAFKIAADNSKNILTSKGNLSVDGGWKWKSIVAKLNEGDRFYHGSIIPINIQGKKITIAVYGYRYQRTLYFGSTMDEGASWNWKTPIHYEVNYIYIDPYNASNIIISKKSKESESGEYNGLNVYFSTDCGETWKLIFSISKTNILEYSANNNSIKHENSLDDFIKSINIVSIDNKKIIYMGLSTGLIYSKDEGTSWLKMGGIHENK